MTKAEIVDNCMHAMAIRASATNSDAHEAGIVRRMADALVVDMLARTGHTDPEMLSATPSATILNHLDAYLKSTP